MTSVAIVGLGYVGIPLAVEFGKHFPTVGFDISAEKVALLQAHHAPGGEVESKELADSPNLTFSDDPHCLAAADFIILAVPTLVNAMHQPDLNPLVTASKMVGKYMKPGVTVVYESTVYPGATEEVCIPALEAASGLKWKIDFHVGYSPERVNPGDKKHTLVDIIKIVSGDTLETLESVATLYEKIIKAGVYRTSCIKVAEAAKVVENTQRDLNIGLMNEVAIISNLVGIDTKEVIDAASTKWNFIPIRPGLVGGHCIGVVPYYLTYKAEMLGYHPDVILAGRRINDGMGKYIADQTVKQMIAAGIVINGAKVCIFGLAFKENVQDLSNSKIIDTVKELESFGVEVIVYDPVVKPQMAYSVYGVELIQWDDLPIVNAIIFAISHDEFMAMSIEKLTSKLRSHGCFIDVQSAISRTALENAGFSVWRL
ncbi:nucleotide sugar dehydrogenase [Polynucleobacter sp. JS-Safj-400b-B2]|uniref:nucleotide sugar dehydrogenase n=1 Tax=Polynucleobacter sp. JS-Safj-400b-B2 TaxID=2576921 RepID=UPI001C0ADD47|nr:nucleotide sugar dehydrogenase [Polynucleobacter sp. JS-Safj-400b-B2]MBU3626328.1 nucleotide sugar dehydrogenase [Polynucleobacter sp. JS-Safj-400b-B2]